jgi:prophage antirepressor-like protein
VLLQIHIARTTALDSGTGICPEKGLLHVLWVCLPQPVQPQALLLGVVAEAAMAASVSQRERSRSPLGSHELALTTHAVPPRFRSFDLRKMELNLEGTVVPILQFSGEPDVPWFPAKPIVLYLQYTQVTYALDHVHMEDKMSLKDLVKTKGVPSGVGGDSPPTIGYHDGKAIWINESGLYALIFGSKKDVAKDFKLWVTRQVLPSLRRDGVYSMACSTNASVLALASTVDKLSAALKERDAALALASLTQRSWSRDRTRSRKWPFHRYNPVVRNPDYPRSGILSSQRASQNYFLTNCK